MCTFSVYTEYGGLVLFVDPPEFTTNPVNTNGTVSSSVKLDCTTYGYPRPILLWLKDGDPIGTDFDLGSGLKYMILDSIEVNETTLMATISIENLNYDDNGMYACRANNALFTSNVVTSSPGILDVHCKHL